MWGSSTCTRAVLVPSTLQVSSLRDNKDNQFDFLAEGTPAQSLGKTCLTTETRKLPSCQAANVLSLAKHFCYRFMPGYFHEPTRWTNCVVWIKYCLPKRKEVKLARRPDGSCIFCRTQFGKWALCNFWSFLTILGDFFQKVTEHTVIKKGIAQAQRHHITCPRNYSYMMEMLGFLFLPALLWPTPLAFFIFGWLNYPRAKLHSL